MKDLWNKEFAPQSVETPKEIIEQQCDSLERLTKGKITAKLSEYDGHIASYIKSGITSSIGAIGASLGDREVNIQEDLGEIKSDNFIFEFFITSKSTPNYKYRVMFIKYGIEFYPTLIVLDESIASELDVEQNIEVASQEKFEEILEKILNSNKIEKVINALLAIAMKEEKKLSF